ncbi:MAG: hypothetical protein ACYS4W_14440 [Planctomycetota bacterium]|jgi:hypothetical protein
MWFLPDATVLQAKNRRREDNLGNGGNLSDVALAFEDDFGYNSLVNRWGLGVL